MDVTKIQWFHKMRNFEEGGRPQAAVYCNKIALP